MSALKSRNWVWLTMAGLIATAPWMLGSVQPSIFRWQLAALVGIALGQLLTVQFRRHSAHADSRGGASWLGILTLGFLFAAGRDRGGAAIGLAR